MNYKQFFEEIKKLVRDLGRSNMIHKEEIINLIEEVEDEN